MAYFDDLTQYEYSAWDGLLNIGWLCSQHPYNRGECPRGFAERLLELCRRPANSMRGFHICDLCQSNESREYHLAVGKTIRTPQLIVQCKEFDVPLGNGEIHISGTSGRSFSAPTLIYHYVVAHSYRPPDEFIEAVMRVSKGENNAPEIS